MVLFLHLLILLRQLWSEQIFVFFSVRCLIYENQTKNNVMHAFRFEHSNEARVMSSGQRTKKRTEKVSGH